MEHLEAASAIIDGGCVCSAERSWDAGLVYIIAGRYIQYTLHIVHLYTMASDSHDLACEVR